MQKKDYSIKKEKKNLPLIPKKIGIITSSKGAVIKDILHRIKDRFPLHVILWDVQVQGNEAAMQITEAIEGFNDLNNADAPDLLIIARGGGSIEDLWPFNEEVVIRAAAQSEIPIISAIGHETDNTLLDLVADKRAPTPTAAAEMAVPVKQDLMVQLKKYQDTLSHILPKLLILKKSELEKLTTLFEKTTERFTKINFSLKQSLYRLNTALINKFNIYKNRFNIIDRQLKPNLIENLIMQNNTKLEALKKRIERSIEGIFYIRIQRLESYKKLLISYNHKNVLKRGFAMVTSHRKKLINSAKLLHDKDAISIEFFDGIKKAKINDKIKLEKKKESTFQSKLPF